MTTAQILALPTQVNTRLLKSSDDGFFYAIEAGESGANAKKHATTAASAAQITALAHPTLVFDNVAGEVAVVYGDIPDNRFELDASLKTLVLGNSVTSIGSSSFSYCSGFTGSLTIPNSVTSIGAYAFNGCSGFTGALTIGDSVTEIGDLAFLSCSGFTGALTIPNSVTTIGNNAFFSCSGFTGALTIPSSVTSIGSYAFYNCSAITSVNCYVTRTIADATNAFLGCTLLTTIRAQAADGTWTAGADTIGGLAVTVVKDL